MLTEKQKRLLEVVSINLKDKSFIFSDLKQYGEFYPATLTSLVKLGLIEAKTDGKKKVYKFISDYMDEETELQLAMRQVEGIITHLDNSKASWAKQLEEIGIEFPGREFQEWEDLVRSRAEEKLNQLRAEFAKQEASNSAF